MNINRLVIGSLVGTVTLYILGILIFQTAFAEFYAANVGSATGVERESQIIWAGLLGALSYGVALTLALETRGDSITAVDGLKVGAIVGFLIWFTVDLTFYGIQNVNNLTLAFVDPVLEAVRGGIAGTVIAAVSNQFLQAKPEASD